MDEAHEEIMILTGRDLREEILELNPKLNLSFLSDLLDVHLPSERRAQLQKHVKPPLLHPSLVTEENADVAVIKVDDSTRTQDKLEKQAVKNVIRKV